MAQNEEPEEKELRTLDDVIEAIAYHDEVLGNTVAQLNEVARVMGSMQEQLDRMSEQEQLPEKEVIMRREQYAKMRKAEAEAAMAERELRELEEEEQEHEENQEKTENINKLLKRGVVGFLAIVTVLIVGGVASEAWKD